MKFTAKVLEIVKKIPKGHILTYKQVAQKAGSVGSSRAVGSVLRKNYNLQIPCHRVICSSGDVGNYNRGGSVKKKLLLKKEGAL